MRAAVDDDEADDVATDQHGKAEGPAAYADTFAELAAQQGRSGLFSRNLGNCRAVRCRDGYAAHLGEIGNRSLDIRIETAERRHRDTEFQGSLHLQPDERADETGAVLHFGGNRPIEGSQGEDRKSDHGQRDDRDQHANQA